MATPESAVKKAIKAWLDARGFWRAGAARPKVDLAGWYYMPQNVGFGTNGVPDFVGSGIRVPGYRPFPWAIEAKAPGGKPTELQKERHAEMRAAGWLVLVADSVSALAELESYFGREIPGTGSPA
jgi:hypothetical protein